jgi:hypothetical protein
LGGWGGLRAIRFAFGVWRFTLRHLYLIAFRSRDLRSEDRFVKVRLLNHSRNMVSRVQPTDIPIRPLVPLDHPLQSLPCHDQPSLPYNRPQSQ